MAMAVLRASRKKPGKEEIAQGVYGVGVGRQEEGGTGSVNCYSTINCNSARLGYHSKTFQSFFESCPAVRVSYFYSTVMVLYRISPKLKTKMKREERRLEVRCHRDRLDPPTLTRSGYTCYTE